MADWSCLLGPCSGARQAAKTLDLYFIDVEGGQATLVVAPSGQSLLIDTGYTGFGGRDTVRIAAAAKDAGVKRIDTLLITHFHDDHVGGVANLLDRFPVTTFLDHGPSIETHDYPGPYAAAIAKGQHKVVAAGDKIPIKDLDVTVVAAAGKVDRAVRASRIRIARGSRSGSRRTRRARIRSRWRW